MRKGRKRKIGERRGGRLIQQPKMYDGPTPQVEARRAWFSHARYGGSEDYPLGVMLINEVITEREHQDLCHVGWIHLVLFGRPSLAAGYHEAIAAGKSTRAESSQKRVQMKYDELRKNLSDEVYNVIRDIVVFGKMPRWLLPTAPRIIDVQNYDKFRAAVDELTKVLRG